MTAAATATEILSLVLENIYWKKKMQWSSSVFSLAVTDWESTTVDLKNCENLGTAKEREVSVIHR